MTQITCSRARFLPLAMASSVLLSVSVPYLIAVFRGKVTFFLPYISHAAAFPPQSALLSIFMTIGALLGIMTFALRFVAVEHRRVRLEAKKVRILNKAALAVGILANLTMIFISHNPVGFITHDKHDWFIVSVIPHIMGAGFLLTSYTIYVLVQSYLTYAQRKRSSRNVFGHAALSMCIVITNWTTLLPFYAAMRELARNIVDPETGEISLEAKEYSFYYIISSLSQWAFIFFSILFILTFYRDMKRMKVTLSLTPKMVKIDSVETAVVVSNGGEEMTKM